MTKKRKILGFKQEHRFVAELYRFLAPFVDVEAGVFLSLDGMAALRGVEAQIFEDSDIPDLWFTVVGSKERTLIEAKILNVGNKTVTVQPTQLRAWRTNGTGKHAPLAWVAADHELKRLYYWKHIDFRTRLDGVKEKEKKGTDVKLPDPKLVRSFSSYAELALHILCESREKKS